MVKKTITERAKMLVTSFSYRLFSEVFLPRCKKSQSLTKRSCDFITKGRFVCLCEVSCCFRFQVSYILEARQPIHAAFLVRFTSTSHYLLKPMAAFPNKDQNNMTNDSMTFNAPMSYKNSHPFF